MKILIHIFVSAVAVFVTGKVLPGVRLADFGTALVVAVVLGLVNGFLRPVLFLLTLPINLLSLGLFTFVIMGFCVEVTAHFVPGFVVASFAWAMGFALVLSVVNSFLHGLEKVL